MATKKLTRTAVKKGLSENHEAMVAAVHRVLKKNGVEGLTGVALILDIDLKLLEQPSVVDELSIL
jgi:O6-methylguanine-DNA--protein-cysteine methyltransferase